LCAAEGGVLSSDLRFPGDIRKFVKLLFAGAFVEHLVIGKRKWLSVKLTGKIMKGFLMMPSLPRSVRANENAVRIECYRCGQTLKCFEALDDMDGRQI
jgi:hypothetical protein